MEIGKKLRKHILRDGGAGADAEQTRKMAVQGVEVELKLAVNIEEPRGISEQYLPGFGQLCFGTVALEEPHFVMVFHFADMFRNGRLSDVKFFGGFGKIEPLRHRVENL